jgi:epsilon-lactone hydrolase
MSLRLELARIGLRWFIKSRRRHMTFDRGQRLGAVNFLLPRPPADTKTVSVDGAGAGAQLVTTPSSLPERYILYIHGGGYVMGSPTIYRDLTWRIATAARACVLVVDYRLAPAHPFPAALEDVIAAYRWLLENGVDPRHIAVMGDSAGGGLTFSMLMKLRDDGLPLPAAAVALSPWTDLALTGESLRLNARADPMVNIKHVPVLVNCYLADGNPRNPYASPIYGNAAGLPPTLIQVGSDEVLRDDAVRMADRLRETGGDVELEIWPRTTHVWHLLAAVVPEARQAIARIGDFVQGNVKASQSSFTVH